MTREKATDVKQELEIPHLLKSKRKKKKKKHLAEKNRTDFFKLPFLITCGKLQNSRQNSRLSIVSSTKLSKHFPSSMETQGIWTDWIVLSQPLSLQNVDSK